MRKEIRVLYILTHLPLIINEWSFCFLFRIYPVFPLGALYCEGPLCNAGINKQILTAILSVPVILITSPFVTLMMRMHQLFVPMDNCWKLSLRTQILLAILLNGLLIANVLGFGIFGKDHDDSERLMKEPELAWLSSRGGTIFLFGPPGDAQFFQWELYFLGLSILIISPFLVFFTLDAMKNIAISSSCMGAVICYIVPLPVLLSLMLIDTTSGNGTFFAFLRICLLTVFTLNGHQFFFIIKNPKYRKLIYEKIKLIVLCKFSLHDVRKSLKTTVGPTSITATSRQEIVRI